MTTVAAPSLAERRTATATELETLEREQAVAVLDGKSFDAKRLAECREELAALDGADAEQVRRDRAATAAQGVHHKAETRSAMAETLKAYLDAVEGAEAAARTMVDGFKQADAKADQMRRQIRSLGGMSPTSLDPNETRLKHSAMLATALATLNHPNRFGALTWTSVPPIPDWSGYVHKFVAPVVEAYFQGESHAQ